MKKREEESDVRAFLECTHLFESYDRGPEPPDFEFVDSAGTTAALEVVRAVPETDYRQRDHIRQFEDELRKELDQRGLRLMLQNWYVDHDAINSAAKRRKQARQLIDCVSRAQIPEQGMRLYGDTLAANGVEVVDEVYLSPLAWNQFAGSRRSVRMGGDDLEALVREKGRRVRALLTQYSERHLLIVTRLMLGQLRLEDVPADYSIATSFTAIHLLDLQARRVRNLVAPHG